MEKVSREYEIARVLDEYFEMKKEGGYLAVEKEVLKLINESEGGQDGTK